MVECNLAKVKVAGSNPVSRSILFFSSDHSAEQDEAGMACTLPHSIGHTKQVEEWVFLFSTIPACTMRDKIEKESSRCFILLTTGFWLLNSWMFPAACCRKVSDICLGVYTIDKGGFPAFAGKIRLRFQVRRIGWACSFYF